MKKLTTPKSALAQPPDTTDHHAISSGSAQWGTRLNIDNGFEPHHKSIERIIVADGNAATLAATCRPLRGAGYEVFEANTASGALALAHSIRPDIVLTEISLPPTGGLELADTIRSASELKDILVVHMTEGPVLPKVQEASQKSGADAYIARPIPNGELLARINALYRQKRMMEALQRREHELRCAYGLLNFHVNNSPLAVIEWDTEFRVRRWSGRAETIFGWRESEVLGRHPSEWAFVHPDDMVGVDCIMLQLLDGSTPQNVGKGKNLARSGEVVHTVWYNSAHIDEDGNLISILSLVNDVTDRVRDRKALKACVHELLEMQPVPAYICNASGWILQYNQAAMELWRREPETGEGGDRYCGSWKIYLPNGKRLPHEECAMAETLRTGQAVRNCEIIIKRPDGSCVASLANTSALVDDNGDLVGAVNCLLKVSDRKTIDDEQRDRVVHLTLVLELIVDGLIRIGDDGVIESLSPTAEKILGAPASRLLGQPLKDLLSPAVMRRHHS
jgi:PAS domain S-box-containing protein